MTAKTGVKRPKLNSNLLARAEIVTNSIEAKRTLDKQDFNRADPNIWQMMDEDEILSMREDHKRQKEY